MSNVKYSYGFSKCLSWALLIVSVASLLSNIVTYSADDYASVDVAMSAMLIALVADTIFRFLMHKPDAVILAKTYVVV